MALKKTQHNFTSAKLWERMYLMRYQLNQCDMFVCTEGWIQISEKPTLYLQGQGYLDDTVYVIETGVTVAEVNKRNKLKDPVPDLESALPILPRVILE